jgi:lipid A ethanolaminephosphotransferase
MRNVLVTRLLIRGPTLSTEVLVLLTTVAFSAFYNRAAWGRLFGDAGPRADGNAAVFAALFVAVTAIQFAVLALLVTRRTVRPVLMALFVGTAFASFFMDQFGVFLDADMMRNVLHTDPPEARELLTPELGVHLLLYAVLPVALLSRVRVLPRNAAWRAIAVRAATVVAALAVAAGAVFGQFRDISTLVRGHRDVRHLITPANYLASLTRVVRAAYAAPKGPRTVIGADAHRVVPAGGTRRPQLLVLVIGETVRSANFGLSGYARQNTPELAQLDLAVFPRVRSCGTSTEVSVPCMFAPVGRRNYDAGRIERQESLLHVLARAGLDVAWIDNQSGCKGVCDGLPTERLHGRSDPTLCDGERCLDELLLNRLQEAAARQQGDLVVVLHMLGNHGPGYSRRYPPAFRRFTPTCESLDLGECTPQEIINAYDNAVLYTDHVLAMLVRSLAAVTDRETGLIYVSDHGESLGENGIYLHGLPYRIAPAEQVEVPMLVWLSPALAEGVDYGCLKARAAEPASHDNLFHSVLGLLNVRSVIHDPGLDVFDGCRPAMPLQVRS